jgi:hypothetical protein
MEPILVYKKPRSKQRIEVHIDYTMSPDGWFLDVQYIENKTNKIAHRHCIIEKDLEGWKSGFIADGWSLVN